VHLGVGIGALEAAAEYTRTITRAWPYDGDDKAKASEEWYILEGYGRLQAKLWAAVRVSKLIHAPREQLTARARGEIAVQVAATKVTAIEISLEVGSKIFELVGARGSLAKWGFDRFLRNTRGLFAFLISAFAYSLPLPILCLCLFSAFAYSLPLPILCLCLFSAFAYSLPINIPNSNSF
jgi:alkylation response protein AidB-like acyl-CoA dehydrogenase